MSVFAVSYCHSLLLNIDSVSISEYHLGPDHSTGILHRVFYSLLVFNTVILRKFHCTIFHSCIDLYSSPCLPILYGISGYINYSHDGAAGSKLTSMDAV